MTNDEFIALTTEAGFEEGWVEVCNVREELTRLIELAVAKGRDECAVFLENTDICGDAVMDELATAIRARNK